MTQEEKDLLLKDICARLPYGVKIHIDSEFLREKGWDIQTVVGIDFSLKIVLAEHNWYLPLKIKPYLRPMSSMTEEEKETHECFFDEDGLLNCSVDPYLDWLNANHFDYRGLIPMGLALEAPEGMYGENC